MTHAGETGIFDRIEQPDNVRSDKQSINGRDDHTNSGLRHRCPDDRIPPQGRLTSFAQGKDIRIIESIYDIVGLRQGVPKTVLQDEFDFFGSMVRAKRIFAKHKT
ncbi:hypothetical protein CO662_29650 [Rhizobium anhuiense]|uniref:Uncharacterized protein n=1 Tax=Rhizobium anhuiense TaxID=1184720 RepID=A0ABX4J1Y4_9HYPH|nr:hypothetical protein [Rhizobium anhuiense]PDS35067.1 hypothetical protein CO665_27325 [Rhizobium anhuiense]PDS41288.1 hypothetical protein CO668_29455 [Rhizobium anhuiense]PDS48436.1 hypothetical protein CO662_29650 [Rhizobium anhuiense]